MGARSSSKNGAGRPATSRRYRRITAFDAMELCFRFRPSLSRMLAEEVVNEFLSLTPSGRFEDRVPRASATRSFQEHGISKDMEILNRLVILFADKGASSLTLRQWIEVSGLWLSPTNAETIYLQFKLWDADRDGLLGAADITRALQYGMPPILKQALVHASIGPRGLTKEQFRDACARNNVFAIRAYQLQGLAHVSVGMKGGSLSRGSSGRGRGSGDFSQAVQEVSAGLGVQLAVTNTVTMPGPDPLMGVPVTDCIPMQLPYAQPCTSTTWEAPIPVAAAALVSHDGCEQAVPSHAFCDY